MEYQILPRRWRHASCRFRRTLEATWHAYFAHLGFTPQYLSEPVTIGEAHQFTPNLYLPEWRAFVYTLPAELTRIAPVKALTAQAFELVKQLPHSDAFVIFGQPDVLDTYIELYSLRSDVLAGGVNRWTIGGNIDKLAGIAYFWMLFSADGRAYIPNTAECFAACYCKRTDCEMCSRIESFLPVESYGEPFAASDAAHRISTPRAKAPAACKIAERQKHPWRTHG